MKLKNSLFSKAIIWNNLKRFWWVSALYILGLFLLSPLVVLTNSGNDYIKTVNFNMIFDGTLVFLFIVPVFISVMIFRYMQNSKAMVTMHAMPFNRLQLYLSNIVSGLILLLIPIMLNTALLSYIQVFVETGMVFDDGIVLRFLWGSTLASVTLFSVTTAVGMITGSSIAQIIFTYIFNFLIPGLAVAVNYIFEGVLYGFGGISESALEKILLISPIVQSAYLLNDNYSVNDFWVTDTILILAALILGYFIYRFRNLEDAGEVVSGRHIKPVFKYGVTVCAMLVGTIYVKAIFNFDSPSLWIYIAFALLGYAIAEMLLRKSFKILDSYKGFIGFIGVFAIVSACVAFDIFGYEDYVPQLKDVKSFGINLPQYSPSDREDSEGMLVSKENIEKIIAVNSEIVGDKERNRDEETEIRISYRLNSGKTVSRLYNVDYDRYEEALNEIYDSKEYKFATNEIFDKSPEDVYSIRISNSILSDRYSLTIDDKAEIEELFNAIKQDTIELTAKETEEYRDEIELEVMFNDNSSLKNSAYRRKYIAFNKNAKNVLGFIEKKGYSEKIIISSDNISNISFWKANDGAYIKTITDRNKIEDIINALYASAKDTGEYYSKYSEGLYMMQIEFSNGQMESITFAKEEYPDIINCLGKW